MSDVRLVIRDASRSITGTCELGFADAVVAALSDEPETIEEMDAALARFRLPGKATFFRGFAEGDRDEPHDSGVVIVDVTARLAAYGVPGVPEFELLSAACIPYRDGTADTDVLVRFHLPDDCLILRDVAGWRELAEHRRRERAAYVPIEFRPVVYGRPLVEFIAAECFKVPLVPLPENPLEEQGNKRNFAPDHPDLALVRDVHARWLTTPRQNLCGAAPRDVMLHNKKTIGWNLEDRSQQWSEMRGCPPGLGVETHAYRFSGFGTHECVVYYEMVRMLVWACRDHVREQAADQVAKPAYLSIGDFIAAEVPILEKLRDEYLATPEPEYSGRTPRDVIENERRRIPEGGPAHEHIVDHDCPLCQMMADMPGPMFWWLDGCNMDDDFAFSFHRTREEYDEEKQKWADFDRKYEETRAEEKRLGVEQPPGGGYASPDYVWERSFVAKEGADFPAMRLFAVGSRLAELVYDLKYLTEARNLIDQLSRNFGNLREVTQSDEFGEALVEPVVTKFCETLDAVAASRSDLAAKCESLESDLKRFWETPSEVDPESGGDGNPYTDDDLPF